MYKTFENNFLLDDHENFTDHETKTFKVDELNTLFKLFQGASFNKGNYRILKSSDVFYWTKLLCKTFPEFSDRIIPFGYDWLGRFFCLDLERLKNAKPQLLLFSHFSNEVLEIPADIIEFHNNILINQVEVALECTLFKEFLAKNNRYSIEPNECAELILPLFLGGKYAIDNMRIIDIQVSWEICSQLISQLRMADEGSLINKVSIKHDS